VYTAIGICHAGYADCLLAGSGSPDDGQKTCPKHVDFYSKNIFEKLVHLVGSLIRIYHDARSTALRMSSIPSSLSDPLESRNLEN
jgi:hypothetical protein